MRSGGRAFTAATRCCGWSAAIRWARCIRRSPASDCCTTPSASAAAGTEEGTLLRWAARNGRVTTDPRAPRMFGADPDADARAPRHVSDRDAAVLDVEPFAEEIEPVLRQRNPHRHRQIPRTAAELVSPQAR